MDKKTVLLTIKFFFGRKKAPQTKEIEKMVDAADLLRDKTVIATLVESGYCMGDVRTSELKAK